ncbi:MAG: type II toxin-antitoxin system RelE/ParE family toxin [Gammaproteobacteria bacterium]
MNELPALREIRWQGDSRDAAHRFPKGARVKLGKELTRIQMGLQPRNGKWLSGIGRGVQEVRVAHRKDAYRAIYVAILGEHVYVLHAFQKKAKTGIETPREELDIATQRYKDLVKWLRKG